MAFYFTKTHFTSVLTKKLQLLGALSAKPLPRLCPSTLLEDFCPQTSAMSSNYGDRSIGLWSDVL